MLGDGSVGRWLAVARGKRQGAGDGQGEQEVAIGHGRSQGPWQEGCRLVSGRPGRKRWRGQGGSAPESQHQYARDTQLYSPPFARAAPLVRESSEWRRVGKESGRTSRAGCY